jgi:hypothetical protein
MKPQSDKKSRAGTANKKKDKMDVDEDSGEEEEWEEDTPAAPVRAASPVRSVPKTKPRLNISFSDSEDDEIPDDAVRSVMKATKTFDDLFGEPEKNETPPAKNNIVFNKDSDDESDNEVGSLSNLLNSVPMFGKPQQCTYLRIRD